MNVDYVYKVDHMVQGGETILSDNLQVHCGGKGLNQSIALSRAGIKVFHAGLIGTDGEVLLNACHTYGVSAEYVRKLPVRGGHTIIQVDRNGQNCIILYGGTNQMVNREYIDEVLENFGVGDYLVMQNEISQMAYLIDRAYEKGMKLILNPSPYNGRLKECSLEKVTLFLVNEIEGWQMTGEHDPQKIMDVIGFRWPGAHVVLTLGADGAWYSDGKMRTFQDIYPVRTVDTTAAGDTFTGFFIASRLLGRTPQESLRMAAKAASIAVSREGAAESIPTMEEVEPQ